MSDIHERKRAHLSLCHTGDVRPPGDASLFGEVRLVHDALPELSMDELDLSCTLLDHTLAAPLMVTGMTGGPAEAGEINRTLARLCESLGLAFGVGSQRVMARAPATAETFTVRDVAPDVVLFGNLGVAQCRAMGPAKVKALVDRIGADYLAVHLNPAMELVQPGADADRDFRGGYEVIGRLVDALDGRVIVKECGCGLSPRVVRRLRAVGVRAVDVSGVGGTSWTKVESLRADGAQARLGALLSDWGVPTAAATMLAAPSGVQVVASGGVTDGLVAAKALALGATVAGFATPVLRGLLDGGEDGARAVLEETIAGLRAIMVLTGCQRPEALRQVPRVLGPNLRAWLADADTPTAAASRGMR